MHAPGAVQLVVAVFAVNEVEQIFAISECLPCC